MTKNNAENTIAFQGEPGAYSHLACKQAYPDMTALPCPSFGEAFNAVEKGLAKLAMIPIENSLAGRVADIHQILPHSTLHIIGEHFLRVRHQLLATQNASLETVKFALSHLQALGQCCETCKKMGITQQNFSDTAGAAKYVAEQNDPTLSAVASSLAGEIYGLKVLKADIEDADHNTTRFIVLSRDEVMPDPKEPTMMAFLFRVRNVPAALYKAMGGFATNGVNMTKLESYQLGGKFTATQFYAEIEGHPSQRKVQLAMEELKFFTSYIQILGAFPKSGNRGDFN